MKKVRPHVEIFADREGYYRYRVVSSNGVVVGISSHGCDSAHDAQMNLNILACILSLVEPEVVAKAGKFYSEDLP